MKAGGCASKLSPKILEQVLSKLPSAPHPDVLVGYETSDDAGVYRVAPDLALVQTVDFFTPMVDDPYTFGAIAAANALSDVWAMGGRPLTALSILAWPAASDSAVLEQILRGGSDKMREAGCAILGGHSVNDPEIKFGYAVTGAIHPDHIWKNSTALAGDVLITIGIESQTEPGRIAYLPDALVDPGSEFTWAPRAVVESLGIIPRRRQQCAYPKAG